MRPLAFHSDPKKFDHILFQGLKCEGKGWNMICTGVTYYTKEAFGDELKLLLDDTTRCMVGSYSALGLELVLASHISTVSLSFATAIAAVAITWGRANATLQ